VCRHCDPSHQGWKRAGRLAGHDSVVQAQEAALGQEQARTTAMEPPMGETRGAVLGLLLGALSFSLMTVCVKGAGARLPVAEVVLARGLVSVALSWWMLRRAAISPWGRRRRVLATRGVLGSIALACVYGAVTRLPLATATLLQYLYPTFTAMIAWLSLGELLSRRILLACGCGWLGVLVIARGVSPIGLGATLAPVPSVLLQGAAAQAAGIGVVLAVAGALLTALAYVSVRELGRSEEPLVIVFWFPLMAVPLSLPFVLLDPVLPNGSEWIWLLGVGLFTQLGQIGLTHGLTRLPAARATTIGYVQVAFAALWGWLWFGESIGPATGLGALLILIAALLSR
jgi:drug/metabolite transporter (DMT)-like permease